MDKKNELESNVISGLQNEIKQLEKKIEELEQNPNKEKINISLDEIFSYLQKEQDEKVKNQTERTNIYKQLLEAKESLKGKEERNILLEKEETKLESKVESLQTDKERTEKELTETTKTLKNKEEKNSNLEKEKEELNSELKNLKSDKKTVDKKLSEIEKSLKEKKEANSILEEEKIVLNNYLKEKEDEVKEINKELKELKSFESSIKTPKLMTLLNTLLENSALSTYRKKSAIVDDSSESIYNLLLKLSTGQIFVKSYYETLVEYKKENPQKVSSEEVAFYEAINGFFEKEIIENPSRTKVDGKFDKSKHRGINNEKEGTLDNGIVLIPSDTTNNDKIKVKLT